MYVLYKMSIIYWLIKRIELVILQLNKDNMDFHLLLLPLTNFLLLLLLLILRSYLFIRNHVLLIIPLLEILNKPKKISYSETHYYTKVKHSNFSKFYVRPYYEKACNNWYTSREHCGSLENMLLFECEVIRHMWVCAYSWWYVIN